MPAIPRQFLLILLLAVACPIFLGGQNCSQQQLEGTYIANSMAYAWVFPASTLGITRVDHEGAASNSGVLVTSGPSVTSGQFTSTWTVGPDCTLTITSQTGTTVKGVIVKNGEEIHALQVGPIPLLWTVPGFPAMPTVSPETFYRMSAGANTVNRCSTKDLTGTYAQSCNGWAMYTPLPNLMFLPFSFLGSISSPGDGTFSGSGHRAYLALAPLRTYKNGTITLNSDCTGSASYEYEGVSGKITQRIAAFDQGKRIIAITDSGQQFDVCHYYRTSK